MLNSRNSISAIEAGIDPLLVSLLFLVAAPWQDPVIHRVCFCHPCVNGSWS